jgi:hypothetical protein
MEAERARGAQSVPVRRQPEAQQPPAHTPTTTIAET